PELGFLFSLQAMQHMRHFVHFSSWHVGPYGSAARRALRPHLLTASGKCRRPGAGATAGAEGRGLEQVVHCRWKAPGLALFGIIERIDALAVLVIVLEAEHVDILLDALGVGGFGNDDQALVQLPAQDDLRDTLAVLFGKLADHFVLEHCTAAQRAVA